MTSELEQYLINKFPKLYDTKENSPFKLYGIECSDGWFKIILWLSRYLDQYTEQQNKAAEKYPNHYQPVNQIKVRQIKEKFGTLKFSVDGGNQHTEAVIGFAEYISGYICEFSGKTNDIGYNRTGLIKTRHISYGKDLSDFNYVDDKELRNILNNLNLK